MERLDGWIHSELGVLPAQPTDESCSFALERVELLFKGVVHPKIKMYFYHSFLTLNSSANRIGKNNDCIAMPLVRQTQFSPKLTPLVESTLVRHE